MDHEFDFGDEQNAPIVYVRPVMVADLPEEFRAHSEGLQKLYAVHGEDGQRLAIVKDRRLAFALARQNDMQPVNVH